MCAKLLVALVFAFCWAGAVLAEALNQRHCSGACITDSKMSIKNVEAGLVHYQTENTDSCPASLGTLVNEKFMTKPPLDSWGQPLLFICPGRHNPDGADIISAGRDHIFGTADDINSWEL